MGIQIYNYNNSKNTSYLTSRKSVASVSENTRIALWKVPRRYAPDFVSRYDEDDNKWLESINKNYENEIENFETDQTINLDKFKINTKTTSYSDNTYDVESKYPNGTKVTEHNGINYVFFNIKDKSNRLVAEKIYNYETEEGRKVIYHNIENDGNLFTITRIYSYNTGKNRSTDVVNYGYTGSFLTLTKGCKLEREYYILNGKEVQAEKINDFEYSVTDENGKKIIFKIQ